MKTPDGAIQRKPCHHRTSEAYRAPLRWLVRRNQVRPFGGVREIDERLPEGQPDNLAIPPGWRNSLDEFAQDFSTAGSGGVR